MPIAIYFIVFLRFPVEGLRSKWHEEDRKISNPIPMRSRTSMAPRPATKPQFWQMADALRGSMAEAEYKHVVLGLLFLKYISDAFEEAHARLEGERAQGADPEDPDEYRAGNIFQVPSEARWTHLKAHAKQPTIGQRVDEAMAGIERDNPALKDVLPRDYGRPALDKQRLGQLVDLISNIQVGDEVVTPTRGDPFRQELTELPPEAGMARQFSKGNGDICAIQADGNLGLYDSYGLIRVAQKIE